MKIFTSKSLSCPSSMFPRPLKLILKIFGLSLNSKRQRSDVIFFSIFLIRFFTLILFESIYSLSFKLNEFLFNLSIFVMPVYAISHIFFNLHKFIKMFDASCAGMCSLHHTGPESEYAAKVYRLNVICLVAILIGTSFAYGVGLSVMYAPDSWVIRRTIPIVGLLRPEVERVTALTLYIHEAVAVSYLPISIALYLAYYECLMIFKRVILNRVSSYDGRSFFQALNHLEEMSNIFESHLSLLPFNWLSYCINPSLCSLLGFAASDHVVGVNSLEVWMNIAWLRFTSCPIKRWR